MILDEPPKILLLLIGINTHKEWMFALLARNACCYVLTTMSIYVFVDVVCMYNKMDIYVYGWTQKNVNLALFHPEPRIKK
jgi:hypothetical protein